jgi:hypothetical protein
MDMTLCPWPRSAAVGTDTLRAKQGSRVGPLLEASAGLNPRTLAADIWASVKTYFGQRALAIRIDSAAPGVRTTN